MVHMFTSSLLLLEIYAESCLNTSIVFEIQKLPCTINFGPNLNDPVYKVRLFLIQMVFEVQTVQQPTFNDTLSGL